MQRINLTAWKVAMAVPYINYVASVAMWFSVYGHLKTLKPDTKRTIGKDLVLSIVTLGVFALALPYLVMKETQDAAQRVGITVRDYTIPYYGVLLLGVCAGCAGYVGAMAGEPGSALLPVLATFVVGPLQAHFFLKPFDEVAEQFSAQ